MIRACGSPTTAAALIKNAEIHRYDAKHAFANDQRPEVCSKVDAEAACGRTFAFLRTHLR